jgi:hypothetical protein
MAQPRGWGQAQKGWPAHYQEDWGHSRWTSTSSGSGGWHASSGNPKTNQSLPLGSSFASSGTSSVASVPTPWTPSMDNLRMSYNPVVIKPRVTLRSAQATGEINAWDQDKWVKKVSEMKEVSSGDRDFCSNYGKQKVVTHLVSPKTPLDYRPGQGSRLSAEDQSHTRTMSSPRGFDHSIIMEKKFNYRRTMLNWKVIHVGQWRIIH